MKVFDLPVKIHIKHKIASDLKATCRSSQINWKPVGFSLPNAITWLWSARSPCWWLEKLPLGGWQGKCRMHEFCPKERRMRQAKLSSSVYYPSFLLRPNSLPPRLTGTRGSHTASRLQSISQEMAFCFSGIHETFFYVPLAKTTSLCNLKICSKWSDT